MKISISFIFFISINLVLFSQKKYVKKYYSNNKVLSEEGWENSENKIGYWTFYYKNGNIKKRGHFEKNNPVKYWYFYCENGSKEKEGHYIDGKQNNWWVFYNEEGDIDYKCQLKDDKKDGYCLLYKKDKLIKALQFSNDKKLKEWTSFSSFRKENNLSDLK